MGQKTIGPGRQDNGLKVNSRVGSRNWEELDGTTIW